MDKCEVLLVLLSGVILTGVLGPIGLLATCVFVAYWFRNKKRGE